MEPSNGTGDSRKTKAQLQTELEQMRAVLHAREAALVECQQVRQRAETERDELKTRVAEYEGETTRSEQAQEAALEDSAEIPADEISASKATFRLDLYPRQGHYQGRIEHLLTQDKKPFSGLDQGAIMDFIASHLPHVEEFEPPVVPRSIEHPPSSDTKATLTLRVPNQTIPHDQMFQVQSALDLTTIAPRDLPLSYKVAIYAKCLEGGTRQNLDEFEDTISSAKKVALDMNAHLPQPGIYRLEAVLTTRLSDGTPAPYTAFVEGDFLQVY